MNEPSRLAELGWDAGWQRVADQVASLLAARRDTTRAPSGPVPRPGRVLLQGRNAWHVGLADGDQVVRAIHPPAGARAAGAGGSRLDQAGETPVTGDWVLAGDADSTVTIEAILPRRTVVGRAASDGRSAQQVLAANADIVAICAPADALQPRRLERELAAAWQSGGTPLVILTKTDLVNDLAEPLAAAAAAAPGVEIVPVTQQDPSTLDAVRGLLAPGTTLALLGASGTGKSTLANALVGTEAQRTAGIRRDGRGRHTTTARRLLLVEGGGLVLDTPGLRAIAPWTDPGGLVAAFADIDSLAGECRFRDCAHETEPGCAVRAAVDDGVLDAERWQSWQALRREQAWLARRSDARLMAEERRRWAIITRSARQQIRP